ncbi:MAG: type ISP restriction/modification enzyme [Cyclobacteriaceae bacterium]
MFVVYSNGIGTRRDAWVYNYSKEKVLRNMKKTADFFNSQVQGYKKAKALYKTLKLDDFKSNDSTKISWSSSLIPHLEKGRTAVYEPNKIVDSIYRPFSKSYLYVGDKMIHRRAQISEMFPDSQVENLIISITGEGNLEFSLLIADLMPDLCFTKTGNGGSQCFPLYYYDIREKQSKGLFDEDGDSKFIRRDGVSDFILERAIKQYGKNVSKKDIFYLRVWFPSQPGVQRDLCQ